MTIDELRDLFGLSRRTIHDYVQRRIIPPPQGKGPAARYSAKCVDFIRAWQALQHNNVTGRQAVQYCQEEGISLPEYVQRREDAIRDFGIGVA